MQGQPAASSLRTARQCVVATDRLALVAVGRERDRDPVAQERAQRGGGRAAPALGDLDLLAGPRGLGREPLEPARGQVVLAQPDLREDAPEVRDHHVLRAIEGARGRGQDRVDHLRGAQVAGGDPLAHLARMGRPLGQRHLVVGGVDRVDAVDLRRQVERAGRVEQLGLDPAAQLHRGLAAQPPDRLDVLGDPVGVDPHVVDAPERGQPERLALRDVVLDPVAAVGERRVHVHVRLGVHDPIAAASPWRSSMSPNEKNRSWK